MNCVIKNTDPPSTRDKSLIKLLKSAGLMISASGISITIVLPSVPKELGERLKLLLQERQAGSNSDIKNEEIVVILHNILEYKCISKKQHKQILIKCDLLQTTKK